MSNVIFSRFINQKNQNVIRTQNPPIIQPVKPEEVSPIISPETLRKNMEEKLNPAPTIIAPVTSSPNTPPRLELVHFASLYEFVFWYENHVSDFSAAQQKPLNSLIEAKDITLGGCNCDVEKRKIIANSYFQKFWVQNRHTDLLPTLQKILNTKKLIFGDFLSYPE